MLEEDREEIKELAKETLKEKWYPIQKREITSGFGDSCCFCTDSRENSNVSGCEKWLLLKYKYDFICGEVWDNITTEEIDWVIGYLEELAKTGELTI